VKRGKVFCYDVGNEGDLAMAITISPHILARIDAVVEANDYPNADSLLDYLLAPLEHDTIDPATVALVQEGIQAMERGETIPLTDELIRSIREEAMRAYDAGERAGPHVRP
jgi:Arc/MetJ-type ribon-helix-helix transcriptional regulator